MYVCFKCIHVVCADSYVGVCVCVYVCMCACVSMFRCMIKVHLN